MLLIKSINRVLIWRRFSRINYHGKFRNILLGDIDYPVNSFDCISEKLIIVDGYIDSAIGAYAGTTTACSAIFSDCRTLAVQPDCLRKANILSTGAAAGTVVVNPHGHTGHSGNFVSDFRSDSRQNTPEAATWAAVANRQQSAPRPDIKPNGIEFVAPDHMD
jgi:hypothetical protein